jgi:hypothetical protein
MIKTQSPTRLSLNNSVSRNGRNSGLGLTKTNSAITHHNHHLKIAEESEEAMNIPI